MGSNQSHDTPTGRAAAPGKKLPPGTWSVNLSDDETRDMTTAQIVAGWKNGTVTSEAYVWKDGFADWTPILEVSELRSKLGPATRTSGFGSGPVTPRPSPSKLHDMFGADLGDDVQTAPAPKAAPTPAADDKATGARNESSVLFSLDALKSNATPQEEAPKNDGADLFGLGGGGLGGLGTGGGLGAPIGGLGAFGGPLGSNANDLLTAPVQEPPKPIAAPAVATAALAPARKGKGLIIAAAAGVLLLAGGAIALLSGGGDTDAKATAEEVDPEKEAMAAKLAEAEAQKKKLAEELAAAEAEKKRLAEEEAKKAEEAKRAEEEAKKVEEEAKAKAEEEAKKAAEAKKSDGKTSTTTAAKTSTAAAAPAAGGSAPFNTAAAKSALASAAARAASCKKPGGPTGPGKAVVTFSTSGKATSAVVQGGAYGGTPVGGCIASVFRQATVPPFSGSAVTVSKSFSL